MSGGGRQHGKGYHYKGHDVLIDQIPDVEQDNTGDLENPYTYDVLVEIANHISDRTRHRPVLGIICGSELGKNLLQMSMDIWGAFLIQGQIGHCSTGLLRWKPSAGLSDILEDKDIIPYETIPNFPKSTVVGHAGRMVIGLLKGIPIICMQGRFHCYEGYPLSKVTMPLRVLKLLGVEKMVVSDVAGGLDPDYKVGDIMIIKDHINMPGLGGCSALNGMNDERFGPRFPPMNNAYDLDLRKAARQVAKDLKYQDFIREGVYIMLGGPSYETVAELRFLRRVGVDAVGMSTVAEVIVARHCGMKVFAFSLITNECITDFDSQKTLIHEEILDTCTKREKHIIEFASTMIQKLASY